MGKGVKPVKKFKPLESISVGSRQIIGLLELPSYEVMHENHHFNIPVLQHSTFTSLG
jgi:hypothetical protein